MLLLSLAGCLINSEVYEARKKALTDHDGDSFAQEDDCDDADPAVFPGAAEVCDGLDQDCDGVVDEEAEGATIWYPDADGDVHGVTFGAVATCVPPGGAFATTPDDCDDANAEAYPGARETPYDGVDQDCDGADLSDVDGDGWPSELVGGGDCDDDDGSVNPDAQETWVNGVTDNDCDGDIESMQLDYGASSWSGWRPGDGLGRRIAALGDVDDDGLADIAVGSEIDSTLGPWSGALYRVDGEPGGSVEGSPALYPELAGQSFGAGLDAGRDVSGDGVAELLVASIGTASTSGGAWLVDGRTWATAGSTSVGEVSLGAVAADAPGTYGPSTARFVGDVNGDGVEDIALGECCSAGSVPGSVGRIAIFSSDRFGGALSDADVLIDGPWVEAYFGYAVDRLDDQDGDGLPELLASGGGGLAAAVVPGTASGNVLDLASTVIYGETVGTLARNVHDMDGDGRDDVAIVGQDGVVSFLTALNAAPSRTVDSPTFTFAWSEVGGVYDVLPLGDLDDAGRADVLIPLAWSDSGTQRFWVLMGEDVNADGKRTPSDIALAGVSSVPAALFGYAMVLAGDVNGDGRDDVALGAPEYSAGGELAGGATLITVPE